MERILTQSQALAIERLEDLANAYFSTDTFGLKIQPRYNGLLVGPTGVGKSSICEELARRLKARFLAINVGQWVPTGVREIPTINFILKTLSESPRTVLLLDELDKFTSPSDSVWSRSLSSEIWGLCDRRVNVQAYCSAIEGRGKSADEINERLTRGMYLVGGATFQDIFDRLSAPRAGFNNSQPNDTAASIRYELLRQSQVSPELLSRFSPSAILIHNPTPIETMEILEKTGLVELAASLGRTLTSADVVWKGAGFRAVETLAAELAVAKANRLRGLQRENFKAKIVPCPTITPN